MTALSERQGLLYHYYNHITVGQIARLHFACLSSLPVIGRCLPRIILRPFFPTCPPFCCSGFHGIPAEMTSALCYRDRCPFRTWYKARHHALGFREFGHSTL